MQARGKAICLVDDQVDEIVRFRKFLGDRFIIGAGTSIDDALADLRSHSHQKPRLFLLDLYHSEGPADSPDPQEELNEARANLLKAEASFYATLARLRQTVDGGFRNLRELREKYRFPRMAVAFFTRKGTLDNAIRAYEYRPPTPVIKKPDPPPKATQDAVAANLSKLYDEAFKNNADQMAATIERIIRQNSLWRRYGDHVRGFALGVLASIIAGLILRYF